MVSCMARDARQRADSCGFAVNVAVIPRLGAKKFLAFGDSITAGVSASCPFPLIGDPLLWNLQDVQRLFASVNATTAYPNVLSGQLASRYATQSFTVANDGLPGELASGDRTESRLVSALNRHGPEVLLLQEGINDLHANVPSSTIEKELGRLVRTAKAGGVAVFLGTLLPERPGSCRARAPDEIAAMNRRVRSVAASEGATLVDLYGAFVGQESTLLGQDGLHPTPEGYEVMATTFFNAIRDKLELPPGGMAFHGAQADKVKHASAR